MSKLISIERSKALEVLCWALLIISALTMILAVAVWTSGSIATLVYTTLVFILCVWILTKLKEKIE